MISALIGINWVAFFAAIAEKEDTPDNKYGITQAYLDDANEYSGNKFTLKLVKRFDGVAEAVIYAYMGKYLKKGSTITDMARVHNGGPKGATKRATFTYGEHVYNLYVAIDKEMKDNGY